MTSLRATTGDENVPDTPRETIEAVKCAECGRELRDGEEAFAVEFDRIRVRGEVVEKSVYVEIHCERCVDR